jgi:hypothetical protein
VELDYAMQKSFCHPLVQSKKDDRLYLGYNTSAVKPMSSQFNSWETRKAEYDA